MSLIEIFSIIIIHFIADFIMQDETWALGKSKNNKDLLNHTFTYSLVFWGLLSCMNPLFNTGLTFYHSVHFFLITFICHTITDYFTSRVVSKKFANQEYGSSIPNIGAFTVIGFDQVLHYIQLFLTYYMIFK